MYLFDSCDNSRVNRVTESIHKSSEDGSAHSPDQGRDFSNDKPEDAIGFVCYKPCSTCARARVWLNDHHIPFNERDIKDDNPSASELKRWWEMSGLPLKRFFNTSGQSYRSLNMKDRLPQMSNEEALELLATDGMLVKRPIVVSANNILVGFRPEEWQKALL
ncbi:MAG: arsenate reductase family protein [Bifidobacterium aquikefiri]|uniref:ArsC family transcriptional regulator n=1 Tax=Bifidobacterium aquikefiri TaxID=1653207 RepID=A0A261G1M5_9BIFI|nr:ArsC family transcriptional regulator [Bifidobacterium aquikefiri]